MSERRPTAELLAAYVDGVGELEVEERRRVERYLADPAMRAEETATRKLIDQLRELPDTPGESEVDWAAMERRIHAEVGDEVPRRSFWYRWRFALPAFALAGAAAIVLLVIRANDTDDVSPIAFVPNPTVEHDKQPMFEHVNERVTVYLDGADFEITNDVLDDLDEIAIGDDESLRDNEVFDEASLGFMEPTDLAWIDDLDDDALERAEQALEHPVKLRKGS